MVHDRWTDRRMDRQKKWHIVVGAPPKKNHLIRTMWLKYCFELNIRKIRINLGWSKFTQFWSKEGCNLILSKTFSSKLTWNGFAKYLYNNTLMSNKHLAMLLPNKLERLRDELELNKCYFSLNKAQNQILCNNKNSFE